MPIAYRLCKAAYAPSTPARAREAGNGAAAKGSHWNSKGVPAVYAASSIALAVLELLVQSPVVPSGYQCWSMEMPASLVLVEIALDDLPKDWRDRPYPSAIQALGDKWLAASPVVSVPSAVIKQERNYLINPLHSGYPADRWQQVSDFDFDPRLPWTK